MPSSNARERTRLPAETSEPNRPLVIAVAFGLAALAAWPDPAKDFLYALADGAGLI